MSALKVIHVLRAPVGGLFRHVRDLVVTQAAMGLEVGVVCDSRSADALTLPRLEALRPHLALGLHLVAMTRDIGWRDYTAFADVRDLAASTGVDVLHGHGAKGGAYARLAANSLRRSGPGPRTFYTPHGGSLHYAPSNPIGRVYMAIERHLARKTDGLIFESRFAADAYRAGVGAPACPTCVIPNGLLPEEFTPVIPAVDAADVLFIGELRRLKGVDVLIDALSLVSARRPVTAVIVGDGPDAMTFRHQVQTLGLSSCIRFPGAMPAREAFKLGHIIAVPSRAESFPYIVLEAAAARLPLIATAIGGIPEMVSGSDTELIPPGDASRLADALTSALSDTETACARASRLADIVRTRYTVERMARDVVDFYRQACGD